MVERFVALDWRDRWAGGGGVWIGCSYTCEDCFLGIGALESFSFFYGGEKGGGRATWIFGIDGDTRHRMKILHAYFRKTGRVG